MDEGIRRFIEAEMARDGSPIQTWFEKLVEARQTQSRLRLNIKALIETSR